MDFIIPAGLKEIGAVALVVLFVLLFYFGRIVSGRTVAALVGAESRRADSAEKVADQWRDAHEMGATANGLLIEQNRELIELARTSDHLIRAMKAVHDAHESEVASGG